MKRAVSRKTISQQVAALAGMGLSELRAEWEGR